jgi:hypothetical protein
MKKYKVILALTSLSAVLAVVMVGQSAAPAADKTPNPARAKPAGRSKAAGGRKLKEAGSAAAAATADSAKRLGLWLASQQEDQRKAEADALKILTGSLAPLSLLQPIAKATGYADWQLHLIWSWGDMGFCEGEVQGEIKRLDVKYNKSMFAACIWPGSLVGRAGRACVMQVYACDAARNKFDEMAMEIAAATQMHNPPAAASIRGAGPWNVAEFLRNNRGCR